MGEMRRAIAREEQERNRALAEQKRMTDRFASTLVIAASIIAADRGNDFTIVTANVRRSLLLTVHLLPTETRTDSQY
jgi:hypothetical protein